ncbi:hypothetical protein A7982_13763 [Minicystis rosea]|nr:hypothetical protein A7982_13763 [Minicystis rosea]
MFGLFDNASEHHDGRSELMLGDALVGRRALERGLRCFLDARENKTQPSIYCLVSPDGVVPKDHPIRKNKALADDVLREMSPLFDRMSGTTGGPRSRPSSF